MSDVKFYMKQDATNGDWKSIEDEFEGLKYKECKGLEDKGKPKNIYTESYADADKLRVYMPQSVYRESTTITFTFVFIGDDRQSVYETFYKFVSENKIYYFDTKRKKQAYLLLNDAVTVGEDIYKGSTPYILVDFKFTNIWGECQQMNDDDIAKEISS
jgi:hypothetical protein